MKNDNPHPSVKASVEFITPEKARDLLGSNIEHQRKIAKANLLRIESDLLNDRFKLNGEPIIVGRSGKLLDGQHRLCACVNTVTGFWSVVVRGVEDDYFNIINVGKGRTLADVLKIAGEVNCANLAATLSRIAEYLKDASKLGRSSEISISTSEAMNILAMTPSVRKSVSECCLLPVDTVVSVGRLAWLHCLAHEECPEEAAVFFAKLKTGEMLKATDPVFVFRSRMMGDKQSTAKLPTREVLALLIKTWNSHIQGEQVKQLRWIQSEKFPVLVFKS